MDEKLRVGWVGCGGIAEQHLLHSGQDTVEIRGEGDIFALEDDAFFQAIRRGEPEPIQCRYADGVRTMEVTRAANRSLESGRPVAIDRGR